jgi:hypothetical protein
VAEGLVVDPAHPDAMTMMIAATRDRFDAEPVVAMSWLTFPSWQHEGCSSLV